MKEARLIYLSLFLSVAFILIQIWDGFTRPLGGYYYPDETRHEAIVSGIIFAGIVSLILLGLNLALKKKKLPWLDCSSACVVTPGVEHGYKKSG